MIIYFSSTGNSKYVAKRIAEATEDWTRSITTIECNESIEISKKDNILGIVCPVYFFGLPTNVESFLEKVRFYIHESTYVFFVATYGGVSGAAASFMEDVLKKRGVPLHAKFGVKMVDNWVPKYDVTDKEKNEKILADAEPVIDDIINHIKNRDKGNFIANKTPKFVAKLAHKSYDKARRTENFQVSGACISCMLCVKRCPARAIEFVDKKPKWVKEECDLCLGCVHRCPVNAINYGKKQNHGQYRNPHDEKWEQ